ncbi:alpha/beta hydrolase fold domain-containing protein [Quadrisphaera oryzae]|uniref:alpha/beta hydrolase fold domain-containing protein n=1 Tax=Quadrisphaera TaxID=317661 RepID=UPI0016492B49|nr:alpha/beta hydrolase fold domain-containing protein [Quadrisphaera sp. RL12-1S]MBC3762635.1 alpha/beta hydrolase fold domain-containing protein [Quadrisphaera sp. RL12-1S]
MTLLSHPAVARIAARGLQTVLPKLLAKQTGGADPRDRLPQFATERTELVVPSSPPAPVVVHRAAGTGPDAPVHVNFHGGGYILGQDHGDDALCRVVAVRAGAVVVDVDYAVAPQHPFPAPVRQAAEVVRWVAEHGGEHGWDGSRLTVGGQSAGGAIAAAVARTALRDGGPRLLLQVLHYPPLDLTVPVTAKHSPLARPVLTPWMGEVFDSAYVPDASRRSDPLVSPAAAGDVEDLTGIAPALVIACAHDVLHAEDLRYAARLDRVGALAELVEVPGADHAYDMADDVRGLETYEVIARHVAKATAV